jgi:tripartite-type tricarboxylate transporter receptor subunit TctC
MSTLLKRFLMSLCLGTMLGGVAVAAEFPERAVRIVVPYTPGGFNDTLARVVGNKLQLAWKQSVVVENRPGGNTTIGNNFVAKSPADGYTILITPLPFSALPGLYGAKLPYDALKDFTPLVLAGTTHNVLIVRKDLPVNNVKELVEYAKKNPGKLSFAVGGGTGSSLYLATALLKSKTGIEINIIPYKGAGPALNDLLGGHIDAMFDAMPVMVPHAKAGKVTPLAVTGTTRSAALPDVPTVMEAGFDYEIAGWFGILAPANTPRPIVQRLRDEVAKAVAQPDAIAQLDSQGMQPRATQPDEWRAYLKVELERYTKIIKEAGIKPE